MKIYHQGAAIRGACQIPYKGYVLSISNSLLDHGEIAVLAPDGTYPIDGLPGTVEGIMEAKQKIDRLVRRRERVS